MNQPSTPPTPAQLFLDFARLLRAEGFAVARDQTINFMRAITALGPRSLRDIYWAGRATLAPTAERILEFDALFDAFFREEANLAAIAASRPEKDNPARESNAGALDPVAGERANQSGTEATAIEALAAKTFRRAPPSDRLKAMQRVLLQLAPRRRGYRRTRDSRGDRLDLRRNLAGMTRGEEHAPLWTRRRERLRRVLLLIDISGSMKVHTDDYLRFAHALTQALPTVETFSFGTRLTRLTQALRHRDADRALREIAPAVADWSGGTRIGESFATFLSVPRFARASRGALVMVLSDGLERGDSELMANTVRRLAARSWRLAWLTPLAADPDFSPDTAALKTILPIIDRLGDGSSIASLCDFVEGSARLGRSAPAAGRSGENRHGHHRLPPSHLAPKRPALARRPDAAAHIRAV